MINTLVFAVIFFDLICGKSLPEPKVSSVLDLFKGSWKEDSTRREGLDEFLAAAEVDKKIRKIATATPWVGEKSIAVNGNVIDITGKTGPNLPGIFDPSFAHHLVVDNKTIAEIDLKMIPTKVRR